MLEPEHIETFLGLFGDHLAAVTRATMRDFATSGIEAAVKQAVERWHGELRELGLRRDRINRAIEKLEAQPHRSGEQEDELAALRGQRQVVVKHLRAHRSAYTLSALESLGLLPNYTLTGDGVLLAATLWSKDEAGRYDTDLYEFRRAARMAIREFAPGNSFYAGGHRHRIDALEIGPADEPNYELWRLCPDCGYGRVELEGDEAAPFCPRCTSPAIADTGTRHLLLRLQTALASGSEENARVYDEDDERRRESFDVFTTVDVDPSQVTRAWELPDKGFGAELAETAHLRTLNVGFTERKGDRIAIAGQDRHVTRFEVCRRCGAVKDVRDDSNGTRQERLHQGWCRVRSGSLSPSWDRIELYTDLETEAVRVLVPVSMFQHEERLASFKGALLLGLRRDFGGDPSHLAIERSDMPNRAGQGRRRFLVLYDSVPGGTGYLGRLADPDRMRAVLEHARNHLSRCHCVSEGRQACHRCLLGVVDRHEYDVVRRDLAIEIINGLLDSWDPQDVETVAGIDIGRVEESELERRFKVALQDWAARAAHDEVTMAPLPGKNGYDAFELRIGAGADATRWRIDEQEGLSTSPSTVPDFLIHRMDGRSPDVAVYLDGFQFHASSEMRHVIGHDCAKRAGVRASGRLVWNLTWEDVEAFHKAIAAEIPRKPPPRPLLSGAALSIAQKAHAGHNGKLDFVTVDRNPVALLLDYLRRPDTEQWELLALAAVAGGFAGNGQAAPVAAAGLGDVLERAVEGAPLEVVSPGAVPPVVLAGWFPTANGLPVVALLDLKDPQAECWTAIAVLPDDASSVNSAEHRARWQDWLQWANLLQFLRSQGREALITASSRAPLDGWEDLRVAARARPPAPSPELVAAPFERPTAPAHGGPIADWPVVDVSPAMLEELDFIEDDTVRALVEAVLCLGAPDFVAGYETAEGLPLEAAWPELRIAVLPDASTVGAPPGWDARTASAWAGHEHLRQAIEERS